MGGIFGWTNICNSIAGVPLANGSTIRWSGRTERDAIIGGELTYIEA